MKPRKVHYLNLMVLFLVVSCSDTTIHFVDSAYEEGAASHSNRVKHFIEDPLAKSDSLWEYLTYDDLKNMFGFLKEESSPYAKIYKTAHGEIKVFAKDSRYLLVELKVYPSGFKNLGINLPEMASIESIVEFFGEYTSSRGPDGRAARIDDDQWDDFTWQVPSEMVGFTIRVQSGRILWISIGRDLE